MTWPSTLPSPSLPAPAQMHLPKSLSDITVVVLVRWRVPGKKQCGANRERVFLGVFLWGAINSEKQMAMSSCYLLTRKHPFIYCWIFKIPLNTKLCFCCPLFFIGVSSSSEKLLSFPPFLLLESYINNWAKKDWRLQWIHFTCSYIHTHN